MGVASLFRMLFLPVSVNKNTPPDQKAGWNISSGSITSGAGLQFPLLGRMAKAQVKGVFCSQTPVGLRRVFRPPYRLLPPQVALLTGDRQACARDIIVCCVIV